MSLHAGISRREIIPDKPLPLAGYAGGPRLSTGVHDPLYATALYLDDGGDALLFISVDVLMLPHEIVNTCREQLTKKIKLPASHILISATHTHSAPAVMTMPALWDATTPLPVDDSYVEKVTQQIVAAAEAAWRSAVPARAAQTSAFIDGVGGNRQNPGGIHDRQAHLLYLQDQDTHAPLALSLVYAMHPTVLHADSTLISADFPGFTRQELETHLPGLTTIYHNGTSGNLSTRHHVNENTFREAERLGRRLGNLVWEVLAQLRQADFQETLSIKAKQSFVRLPFRRLPSMEQAVSTLRATEETYRRLSSESAVYGTLRTAEVDRLGAQAQLALVIAEERGELNHLRHRYEQVEVQVIELGEAVYIGLPGEFFVEYGLELKRRVGRPTAVIGLANGELGGYIVTPEAQGYEADFSLFAPEAGSAVVEATLGMMR